MVARFSLNHGGNVISSDEDHDVPAEIPRAVRGSERATWDWVPDGRGRFRLQEHRRDWFDEAGDLYLKDVLRVLEFDPQPEIDPDLFTLQGLQLPPRTVLEDWMSPNRRRTLIGKAEQPLVDEAALRRIAEELRQAGFSASSRSELE